MALKAVAFNCTLKPSRKASSTDLLLKEIMSEMKAHDVKSERVRVVDHDVKPGVSSDEGRGDA
jgi:hypothetical protein